MLNVLGGLDNFDSGDIIINGNSLKSFKEKDFDNYRNSYVGFIFQDNNLLEEYSVKKNIGLALEFKGFNDNEAKIEQALEKVELKGYTYRKPNQLSGGQKQRIAIARAIVKDPKVVLADEPTGNLDSETGRQIFELLKELSQDKLIVVVTHDRESAEIYADRIIELVDGHIASDKTIKDLSNIEDKVIGNLKIAKFSYKRIIGLSINNLKIKWGRLLVTLVLFAFSLILFGIGLSAANVNTNEITYNSMNEIGENIVYLAPEILPDSRINNQNYNITQSQLDTIRQLLPNNDFKLIYNGCYVPEMPYSQESTYYYTNKDLSGYVSFDSQDLDNYGFNIIAGRLPESENEVAIPYYIYETFNKYGYYDVHANVTREINCYNDILELSLSVSKNSINPSNIVGIIDTNFDSKRFEMLKTFNVEESTQQECVSYYNLLGILSTYIPYSVHIALFVNNQFIEREYYPMTNVITETYTGLVFPPNYYSSMNYYAKAGVISYLIDNEIPIKGLYGSYNDIKSDEVIVSKQFLISYLGRNGSEYKDIELTDEVLDEIISNGLIVEMTIGNNVDKEEYNENYLNPFTIIGYYDDYTSVNEAGNYVPEFIFNNDVISNIINENGLYKSIFTSFTSDINNNMALINFSYRTDVDKDFSFSIKTILRNDLEIIIYESNAYRFTGLLASIAFGIFTVLMMLNFIISNIKAKNKEIGILRALGLSSFNVFMIFFTECILISISAFLLSLYPLFQICNFINIRENFEIIKINVFNIGAMQIISMLGISIFIAFAGSFLPIFKLTRKKPVEIIRNI